MPSTKLALALAVAAFALAQSPPDSPKPVASMKQLMVDLIHPAANDILLAINRGGPANEADWAAVRRGAVTLAESGNLLLMRGPTEQANKEQANWIKDAKLLSDVGTAMYKAAQAKDAKALTALADPLDASCTTCHRQFRRDVFPIEGGSK